MNTGPARRGTPVVDGVLSHFLSIAVVVVLAGHLAGCSTPMPPGPGDGSPGDGDGTDPLAQVGDCLGCHTDEDLLKLVARDEPPPAEDTGEG